MTKKTFTQVTLICGMGVFVHRCASGPVDSKRDDSFNQPLVLAAHDRNRDDASAPQAEASTIVQPRERAIQQIREACHDNYEVLEEGPQTSEAGIAVPLSKDPKDTSHWFVRYRCREGR